MYCLIRKSRLTILSRMSETLVLLGLLEFNAPFCYGLLSLLMLVRRVVRAIFRYSSVKVAKTAEMYVYTRRKNCTKN